MSRFRFSSRDESGSAVATDARRRQRILIVVVSACLMLLPGAPGEAQQTESTEKTPAPQGENTFVRSPDSVLNPTPQKLFELAYPELPQQKAKLPAFFRD